MTLDLDRLEKLAKAATPGPWWGGGNTRTGNAIAVLAGFGMDRVADAEFIAATDPTTVLALIAEVRRLRETVGLLHGWEDRAKKAESGLAAAQAEAWDACYIAETDHWSIANPYRRGSQPPQAILDEIRARLANDTGVVLSPADGPTDAAGDGSAPQTKLHRFSSEETGRGSSVDPAYLPPEGREGL